MLLGRREREGNQSAGEKQTADKRRGPEKAKDRRAPTSSDSLSRYDHKRGKKTDSRTRPREDEDGRGGINVFVLDGPFSPASVPARRVLGGEHASVTD